MKSTLFTLILLLTPLAHAAGSSGACEGASAPEATLKPYFANLHEITQFILETLHDNRVETPRVPYFEPSTYYNRLVNNGGLILEFQHGMPYAFWTPLGRIRVTDTLSYSGASGERAVDEIRHRLGLVEVDELVVNEHGHFGPAYAVTLDLHGRHLPMPEKANGGKQPLDEARERALWSQVKPQ